LENCLKESKNEILLNDKEIDEAKPIYYFFPSKYSSENFIDSIDKNNSSLLEEKNKRKSFLDTLKNFKRLSKNFN
jgi:hypothetical protein